MELNIPTIDFPLHSFSKIRVSTLPKFPSNLIFLQRHRSWNAFSTLRQSATAAVGAATLEQPGGKMVVELVGAFNELTERMKVVSSSSSSILFKCLKLSIPLLQALPLCPDGRSPLSKALSVALILADLQMDAEVISAGILREVLEAGAVTIYEVRDRIGTGTAHLLHESLRVKQIPSKVEVLDDDSTAALRKFCLTYYDVRAVILDLAIRLDMMKHLDYLPRYQQQMLSSSHETGSKPLIDVYREHLLQSLKADHLLAEMVDDISVKGRYKSRYSTMKKLLKDGRKPEEINDILGLRVILKPRSGDKDYIAKPKANGYKSLHMAVDVSEGGRTKPLMEIQIRTTEMDMMASGGTASHSLYKGGVTDPEEAKQLKAIMMAAAELAALRLKDLPSTNPKGTEINQRDRAFCLLDKNGDGRISIEELMEVNIMSVTIGIIMKPKQCHSQPDYALNISEDNMCHHALMTSRFFYGCGGLVWCFGDCVVEIMRNLEDRDDQYRTMLNEKLHMAESNGQIQVYRKEIDDRLAVS
ncbi:putative GTP diphosphokinase CRSH, chloroplastic [Vitis vinifera]|uniref:GTP diphosphokinase n=1 Tax=Vitis vinifera TaxID=29760 RepID=A0A438F7C9_VITVI|nr:putative GTP diphosphokinase CRSH, chloroplastic [Vitis vinifera]